MIEVLTVMAIIAILSTITVSIVSGVKQRAAVARAKSELAVLANALEEYKRYYGDYPELGDFPQAQSTPTTLSSGPGATTAQEKLFNCLTGVFGPSAFDTAHRVNGPNFLGPQLIDNPPPAQSQNDPAYHVHLAGLLQTSFLIPTVPGQGAAPVKVEQNVGLLDPWGRYYVYYYKSANAARAAQWQAPGYVLYSAGPKVATNGTQTPSVNASTGLPLPSQTAEMLDNIYANP